MRLAVVAMFLVVACRVAAQGQAFDAASVKPTVRDMSRPIEWRGGPGTEDPGQITYSQITLWNLIQKAYGVELDQISGPAWTRTEWYSVTAKTPPNTSTADFRLMLQHLLAERFHLTLHRETKESAGYDLTVAKGGLKIGRPTKIDQKDFPPLPLGAPSANWISGGMVRSTHKETMAQLAADLGGMINMSEGVLSASVAPRVADKTGLSGEFEFRLEYAASTEMLSYTRGAAGDPAGGPTIFAALEQQLGLKLVKTGSVPVEILVIDHADKVPTEN